MNEFTKYKTTIKFADATKEMLHQFLSQIDNQMCIYPWESKLERLKRFDKLEISKRAILLQLGSRS